jgi:two-component system alkaline phosphatase synthesis response regulator PhoP
VKTKSVFSSSLVSDFMSQLILIIEDEPDISENLRYNFVREGYDVLIAATGESGLELALDEKNAPSLIILDLMLPKMSGLEICRRLRREPQPRKTPIIMLTAKAAEADKIAGLETGADDYITKPFSVREVLARVRAVLRRTDETQMQPYADEKLSIDFECMQVPCNGREIKLTRKEFALFKNLVKNAGRVAARQNLLDDVWGYSYYGDTRTLDVHIRRLRQKLGDCESCIETVIGIGYRFAGLK